MSFSDLTWMEGYQNSRQQWSPPLKGGLSAQRASNAESVSMSWRHHDPEFSCQVKLIYREIWFGYSLTIYCNDQNYFEGMQYMPRQARMTVNKCDHKSKLSMINA